MKKQHIQIIDTFSGIGGFSLAGEWMGWKTVQFVENNTFCQKVLKYYWPDVPLHDDIKTITANQIINNGLDNANKTTIFTGGVPCQPWSTEGKRLGTEDDRDLWKETITLIGGLHPDFVVLENVHGLVNWGGGLVFEQICLELETKGYEVQPVILPACGVNAPHRRNRVWFVAYSNRNGGCRKNTGGNEGKSKGGGLQKQYKMELLKESDNLREDASDTSKQGLERRNGTKKSVRSEQGNKEVVTDTDSSKRCKRGMYQIGQQEAERHFGSCNARTIKRQTWDNFPTQSPICSGNDGFSNRLDGITFPKWRNESIKAYGNAIVPQVAYQIFKAIMIIESKVKQFWKCLVV
jgi:DNA (cytosine-5)-methyltransferase 1